MVKPAINVPSQKFKKKLSLSFRMRNLKSAILTYSDFFPYWYILTALKRIVATCAKSSFYTSTWVWVETEFHRCINRKKRVIFFYWFSSDLSSYVTMFESILMDAYYMQILTYTYETAIYYYYLSLLITQYYFVGNYLDKRFLNIFLLFH